MKLGLVTSTALHGGALALALLALRAPAALETAEVEALPVDIVSIEEFTQIVAGSKEAPKLDAPAPEPIDRPQADEAAENVGEAEVDVAVDPAPVVQEIPVEAADTNTEPEPAPDAFEVTEAPMPRERPAPPTAPTTEIAATAEPEVPVIAEPAEEPTEVAEAPEPAEPAPAEADPIAEAIAASEPAEEAEPMEVAEAVAEPEKPAEPRFDTLPTGGPKALYRPPKSRPARTPSRTKDEPTQQASKAEEGERNVADEVAALLNRETASGGGAKRPDRPASQGGDRTTGAKLSSSEMDALRRAIGACWNPPSGVMNAGDLTAKVRMRLDQGGNVVGRPEVITTSGGRMGQLAAEAGSRAMRRCAPYQLPADKYDTWSEVVVNFDPREMF